jgi:formamidopyrimidine-DNA glycosylase
MPELPEVETTLRGLEPHLVNSRILQIEVRQPKLRWPVPDQIYNLNQAFIESISRRGKYLLMYTDKGHMIWHLGMSGSMRILSADEPGSKHEHIKLIFDGNRSLRYIDPRRFGALLYTETDPLSHKLLCNLGPEPLTEAFNSGYLHGLTSKRSIAIKNLIMDSHIVVGVGNIYACESLFLSGINPKTRASRISLLRIDKLVQAIKQVLRHAIRQGGTTLQDFTQTDGKPGYFNQSLNVYGNSGNCPSCANPVKRITQGQRSTYYCTNCQN